MLLSLIPWAVICTLWLVVRGEKMAAATEVLPFLCYNVCIITFELAANNCVVVHIICIYAMKQ